MSTKARVLRWIGFGSVLLVFLEILAAGLVVTIFIPSISEKMGPLWQAGAILLLLPYVIFVVACHGVLASSGTEKEVTRAARFTMLASFLPIGYPMAIYWLIYLGALTLDIRLPPWGQRRSPC